MPTLHRPSRQLTACIALALAAGAAHAASGTFSFVTGEVSIQRPNGQRLPAQRGVDVDPGDSITTGANGMAQLTMVDQARLSLRPNSQFVIEEYQRRPDSDEGAILNLVRGTLRTFTGLIASRNRDKFTMRTRVATVGIRGSGNILYACSEADKNCDQSVTGLGSGSGGDFAVNHTIEGSHAITNLSTATPGLPAQQGGAQTLITGPGQTVMVQGVQPPRYIPTPQFIADTATNPTGSTKAVPTSESQGTRDFAPGDNQQLSAQSTGTTQNSSVRQTFVTIDASSNLLADPVSLNDVVIASTGTFLGQAAAGNLTVEGTALRGYATYPGSLTNVAPVIAGGTLREQYTVAASGGFIQLGRYESASLGFNGPGSGSPLAGNIHWIYAPSGYPTYLADVLTGTASYTLAAATAPTNQNNTAGTLQRASLDVNFTNRTLGLSLGIVVPASGGNAGGAWSVSADNVPFALNVFFVTSGDRLVIVNGSGVSSATNPNLSGSVEGSLVGTGLAGALLGYGIGDFTASNPANHNSVSGVAAFTGPVQNGAAPYREGRISDPVGYLAGSGYSRNFSTTNRPAEVTSNEQGAVTAFVGPHPVIGSRANYAIGSAQVVQSGIDPETGLVWGRWGGGIANVTGGGLTATVSMTGSGLHYVFAGQQQGPTTLPLTGTGAYDVIGSTTPTNMQGATGTLGSATLEANFTNRTASSTVNVNIAGQSWIGTASSMPIYRDQYFTATTGSNVPGVPNLSPLSISCSPGCGAGATGSFDGFFAGRTGQRAGMLYNMGGVQGAVAFGRRGG